MLSLGEGFFFCLATFFVGIGSQTINENQEIISRSDPRTILDFIVNSGSIVNHKDWRNYVGDDTDLDGDGVISENELEQKYEHLMKSLFRILDTDSDGLVNNNEVKSPKFDLDAVEQIFDAAVELYPIKYWFNYGDDNKDGAVDKDDFDEEKWEVFKRFILLADNDKDEKVTLEELRAKIKMTLRGIFELLDQNEDGYLSIEDFTTINIFLLKIPAVFEHFDNAIDSSHAQIDLLKLIPAEYRGFIDTNRDGLVNLKDFYQRHFGPRYIPPEGYIMAQISRILDKNQDGQVNRQEIQDFFITLFGLIDLSDSDGRITMEDGFKLIQNNGANENQMKVIKKYVNSVMDHVRSEFERAVKYISTKADENGDGDVDMKEFLEMRVDCCIICNNNFMFRPLPEYPLLIKFMDLNKEKVLANLLDNPAFYQTYDVAIFDSIKQIDIVVPIMKAMGVIIGVLILLLIILIVIITWLACKLRNNSKVDITPSLENVKQDQVSTASSES